MNLSVEPNPRVTFGIAFQDDDLLVIEKPARIPTQPGKGHQTDTILNGLFAQFGSQLQNLGKDRDFGLLHRLDKDTSGLLVVALRPKAYDKLREDFAARRIKKFYWAICDGAPRTPNGVIKLPIVETQLSGRPVDTGGKRDRGGAGGSGVGGSGGGGARGTQKLAHIARVGKPAITAYRVLDQNDTASLIEARPITGRLHQVRVHLDAIGCPILGDDFYGPRRIKGASPRLALHAHRLVLTHPRTGETIDAKTDWPRELKRVLKAVRLKYVEPVDPGKDEPEA